MWLFASCRRARLSDRCPSCTFVVREISNDTAESVSSGAGIRHSAELATMELFFEALILFHENRVAASRRPASGPSKCSKAYKYVWRAARAALLLYRSGAGDRWLAEAQRKIEQYPRSFVAAEIGRIVARAADLPSARLMPRQQEILSLLRTGISIDEIAARLRTSRNTVRVHITKDPSRSRRSQPRRAPRRGIERLEPLTGIEPVTSSLPRKCSTTELQRHRRSWSGRRESNPRHQLGRLRHYHYATPARMVGRAGFEPA